MNSHLNIPTSTNPRIVIVGGGFGGIELAHKLKNKPFQIILLDKHNYHAFQPLLYQIATAGLESYSIASPYRALFERHNNLVFRMTEVTEVVPSEQTIRTTIGDRYGIDHQFFWYAGC
jgi:NADH:ubiquinone reductase (H+-translocating)